MPYLHLPVQSGSDRILEAMNRGHDAESYLRTIDQIAGRASRSGIQLRLHCGFPG